MNDASDVDYDGLLAEVKAAEAAVAAKAATAVGGLFKKFFAANPGVYAVRWTQYAPHFNDGDPCVFSVHDFTAAVAPPKEEDNDEGFLESWDLKDNLMKENLRSLKQKIKNNIFEKAFGSDAQVTATREGFDVTEYDHD